MEWLLPDWTYSPLKGKVEKHDFRLSKRPKIELQIFRCRYETWKLFKQHHYLSEDLNKSAQCYIFLWNDKPIGFVAILPFPGVGDAKTRRISRVVVLPDFQGLGLGKDIVNYISSLYWKEKHQMYIRTMNPALGIALDKDINWSQTAGHLKVPPKDSSGRKMIERPSYSFKYSGYKNEHDTNVITFNADAWKEVAQNQISLF
jgi:GNAT superfamily N-acetyltransferase